MKILLLNHFPLTGSGSGVYTQNIANSLIKKGHKVSIIFPENQKIKENPKIKMHPVYFYNKEKLENQLPFNFPCFTTHPRSNKTFYELTQEELEKYINAFKKAIEEEIKTFKPDIIHAGHIWILPSIAKDYNIPLIITAHGTDLIGYQKSQRFRKYADKVIKKATKIITVSKENKKLVNTIFKDAKNKTILIPNGYNPDIFYIENVNKKEFLKKLKIKEYKNIVSFAGKFTSLKGIDLILKAATIYENNETATIIAGDGELFKEMQNLSKKLNLKNIYFIGNKPQETLRKLYNIANVSLVPSRKEAFGLVVIEANSCGIPVIGTNEGGIKDLITKNTGLLFEKENYQELAQKISLILNEEIKFDRKYIASFTKSHYSQDIFTSSLITIYQNAINKTN